MHNIVDLQLKFNELLSKAKTVELMKEAIDFYQENGVFHPLTCGNNSGHNILKTQIEDGQLSLVCQDCEFKQSKHPWLNSVND